MQSPSDIIHLDQQIDELLIAAGESPSGRATQVFRAFPGGSLAQVLLVLREGKELSEHDNPGQALLHVLRGSTRLVAGEKSWELTAGDHIVIPQQRHSLHASEDSAVFLTVVKERA